MTIVPWIPNLAKLLCATRALTFYFHCTIFQLSAQIVHGAGLSRTLETWLKELAKEENTVIDVETETESELGVS
jgi:hypothetical protein